MKTATHNQAAAQKGNVRANSLVSAGWLAEHLDDPSVRVVEVDVSPAAYEEWHIDGATLWGIYHDLKDDQYHLVDSVRLEQLLARSGITPESTVVFYGYAPCMGLWLMELYGHLDVRILDCSRETWRARGVSLEQHNSRSRMERLSPSRSGPAAASDPRRSACRHQFHEHYPRRCQVNIRVPRRALLAFGWSGGTRSHRPHSVGDPPADR